MQRTIAEARKASVAVKMRDPVSESVAVTGARIVRDTFDLRPSVPLRSTQLRRADISADLR
jgi:hypothetical protein